MPKTTQEKDIKETTSSIILGRRIDWTITTTILIIGILFIFLLQSLPERATFFPWFITISIVVIGSLYMWGKVQKPDRWDEQYASTEDGEEIERDTGPAFMLKYRRGIARTLLYFTLLILSTFVIGPKYAVPLFVTLMLWISKENKIVAILSGLFFWLVIEFIFGRFMSINLPTGYLIDWLTQ